MARVQISPTVAAGNPLRVIPGATVTVRNLDGTLAAVYAASTGGSSINPLTTDAYGRALGYVEDGTYDVEVSGGSPAIVSYSHRIEALSAIGYGAPSIASAAAIEIPPGVVVATVTGTTTITSIAGSYAAGRRVTLVFAGALTVTDGSNLKLAGNLVTTADDTLTLVWDGNYWYETSRSVN